MQTDLPASPLKFQKLNKTPFSYNFFFEEELRLGIVRAIHASL